MSNKILITSVCGIIGGLVLLGTGYLVGIDLEQQKTGPQLEKLGKIDNILKTLNSSKIIPSIVAFGEVTKISGRTVTLTYGTENLDILIREDAKIYSFVNPAPDKNDKLGIGDQRTAKFQDIGLGNNLNVSTKILTDGQFEGSSVIIFPSFKQTL